MNKKQWTITKGLMFLSPESKKRRNRVGLQKYSNNG